MLRVSRVTAWLADGPENGPKAATVTCTHHLVGTWLPTLIRAQVTVRRRTALHAACEWGHADVIQWLVHQGAMRLVTHPLMM
jgi:hypothetical protein